jgi:DNA-binding MarR family transcriptional regulator
MVIRQVRAGFHDLKEYSDKANADIGVTASMRALLEYLHEHGAQPAPKIARDKNVTRQHIQQLADALVASGHAIFEVNPDHKRSQLVTLTPKGRSAFAKIRKREATELKRIAAEFTPKELETAVKVLQKMRAKL